MMKRLKLCLVVLKLWFLLRRSQILTVDSPEMWLLIITLRIPNNTSFHLIPTPFSKGWSRSLLACTQHTVYTIRYASHTFCLHGSYLVFMIRYGLCTIRYGHIRYDTVLIRYGSCTIRYVSYTVRNASHTIRNAFHTIRYVSNTILKSHASCTLFRCSSTF